jgi:hypothetical protein
MTLALLVALAGCGTQPPPDDPPSSQTIEFAPLADRFVGAPPFDVTASSTSGLPVSFAAEGVCSVSGRTVTLDGRVGTCSLTASQAGDDDTSPAGPVVRTFDVGLRHVGFVLLSETGADGAREVSGEGTFAARDEPLVEAFPGDPFEDPSGSCLVTDGSAGGGPPRPDTSGTPASAGSTLVVREAGGTYATLVSEADGAYRSGGGTAPEVPLPAAGLTLDVPGDVFPAFSDAPFVATDPFALAAGFDPSAIGVDTRFAWEGSGAADAVALLIGGDGDAVFSCVVPDDGSYEFDEATREALSDAGFASGALRSAGRLTIGSVTEGDAVLLLGVLRLTSFDLGGASVSGASLAERVLRLAVGSSE